MLLFPSLRDTSGTAVLEAMSMGLPVICFDHQEQQLWCRTNAELRLVSNL